MEKYQLEAISKKSLSQQLHFHFYFLLLSFISDKKLQNKITSILLFFLPYDFSCFRKMFLKVIFKLAAVPGSAQGSEMAHQIQNCSIHYF
jgi:dolichol kinase